jgi:hypothetical protein
MKKELEFVIQETEMKVEKLKRASDIHIGLSLPSPLLSHLILMQHTGMEILHLFVLDLLGRFVALVLLVAVCKLIDSQRHSCC